MLSSLPLTLLVVSFEKRCKPGLTYVQMENEESILFRFTSDSALLKLSHPNPQKDFHSNSYINTHSPKFCGVVVLGQLRVDLMYHLPVMSLMLRLCCHNGKTIIAGLAYMLYIHIYIYIPLFSAGPNRTKFYWQICPSFNLLQLLFLFNPGDQGEVGDEGDQGKLGKNGPSGHPGTQHPFNHSVFLI